MAALKTCGTCRRPLQGEVCTVCALEAAIGAAPEAHTIQDQDDRGAAEGRRDPIKFGPYRVQRTLGRGGFGTVYLALQTEPIRREVALKVLKRGVGDAKQMLARFELERQALARMEHPSICRVYDAGETESGEPYFAMEVIDGCAITDYCREKRPSLPKVLGLFRAVCSAVEHAHRRGVIHRDLKPSNILVTERDGEPHPVVIDFGIAKSLEPLLQPETVLTLSFQIVGTPIYMSPEQASSSGHDVDVRSDVYSLGAVLYEMLAGRPPLSLEEFRKVGIVAALRHICEADTPPPSTRISDSRSDALERGMDTPLPLVPAKKLRGDLDWITMRALAKNPERRYQSARDLADDLDRFAARRPVLAGPPSILYRVSKFARRHPVGVAATGAILIMGSILFGARQLAAASAANDAYDRLIAADQPAASFIVAEIRPHLPRLRTRLEEVAEDPGRDLQKRINATLALASGDRSRGEALGYLLLGSADRSPSPEQAAALQAAIAQAPESVPPNLDDKAREIVQNPEESHERQLCATALLAAAVPDGSLWEGLAPSVVRSACDAGVTRTIRWAPVLQPIAEHLSPHAKGIFDKEATSPAGVGAAVMLSEFHAQEAGTLAELAARATPAQFQPLAYALRAQGEETAVASAETILNESGSLPAQPTQDQLDALAQRRARAAMLMLFSGGGDAVWPLLKRPAWGDPRLRTFLIHAMEEYGLPPTVPATRLTAATEPSERAALLIALGGYRVEQIDPKLLAKTSQTAKELARTDPTAEVHSAAEWMLRSWGEAPATPEQSKQVTGVAAAAAPTWERDPVTGCEFAVFPAGIEFSMGSPDGMDKDDPELLKEPGRNGDEFRHPRTIQQGFAIATKVLTVADLKQWIPESLPAKPGPDNMPGRGVSLYAARKLCNLASAAAGIPEGQWCYTAGERPEPKDDITLLMGYRLPTEAEWEYACRGGSSAPRPYGYSEQLLSHYACISGYGGGMRPPGTKRPNGFGMFDMLGNVQNFVEGAYAAYPGDTDTEVSDLGALGLRLLDPNDGVVDTDRSLLRGQYDFEPVDQFRSARRMSSIRPKSARFTRAGIRLAQTRKLSSGEEAVLRRDHSVSIHEE